MIALLIACAIKYIETVYEPTGDVIKLYESPMISKQSQNNLTNATRLAQSWLSCDYCRLILLYPFTTEAGIGIAYTNDGIYATYLIRKQEVKIGDRRYITGRGIGQTNLLWEDDELLTYNSNPALEQVERDVLRIINIERNTMLKRGPDYGVISWNQDLHELARIHSQSMSIKNKLFISPASENTPYYQTVWYLPF
jgi:uncharacterized protein YkwD